MGQSKDPMEDQQSAKVEKWLITHDSQPSPGRQLRKRPNGYFIPLMLALFVALCVGELVCRYHQAGASGGWLQRLGTAVVYGGFWIGVIVIAFALIFTLLSSVIKRTRAWTTDLATTVSHSEIKWIGGLAILGSILNFVAGVALYATNNGGPYYSLGNLIVSAGATVLVAYTGWFTFSLTNGFSACRRLLLHQLEHPTEPLQIPMGNRSLQAQAVWERLKNHKPGHSGIFLTALTTEAGIGFAQDFERVLSEAGVVTLRLDHPPHNGNYALHVQAQFQALMRKARVPPHLFLRGADSYLRVLEHLMQYRKIVIIIRDMDAMARPHGPETAREAVETGADELRSAGFVFVSIIEPTSLPPKEADNSIQITPPNDLQINLPNKYVFTPEDDRIALQRAIRGLSIALQPTRLRIYTVWRDTDTVDEIDQQRDALKGLGLVRFGSDLIQEALDQAGPLRVRQALIDRFLERLVASGRGVVAADDLYRDLSNFDALEVSSVLHGLTNTQPGKLTREQLLGYVTLPGAQRFLTFHDPQLGEIAIGRWLAHRATPYTFSMRRSVLCTAAEIYRRLEKALDEGAADSRADPARGLIETWDHAMAALAAPATNSGALGTTALTAAAFALNAINSLDQTYAFDISPYLGQVWDASDLSSRRTFVERLTETSACRIATWLWERASDTKDWPPQRHILDRTICRKLGTSGAGEWGGQSVWTQLQRKLPKELTQLSETDPPPLDAPGINWKTKSAHKGDPLNLHSIALLGWALPSLAVSAHRSERPKVEEILQTVRDLIATPQWRKVLPDLDVGAQIALAEGCRDACYHGLVTANPKVPATDNPNLEFITTIAKSLICGYQPETPAQAAPNPAPDPSNTVTEASPPPAASAWYSWLVSLQALFVAAAAASDLQGPTKDDAVTEVLPALKNLETACLRGIELGHPIVQEYAQTLNDNIVHVNGLRRTTIDDPHTKVGQYTWLDDNQAVSQAGGALRPKVVEILAKSVFLLNHSGASEILDTTMPPPPLEPAGKARMEGLTRTTLPRCFEDHDAANKADQLCTEPCEFKLCRPGIFDTPVRRELSRTFLQSILHEPRSGRKSHGDNAFEKLLRRYAAPTGKLHSELTALLNGPTGKDPKQVCLPPGSWMLVRGAPTDRAQRLMTYLDPDHAEALEEALERRFVVERGENCW